MISISRQLKSKLSITLLSVFPAFILLFSSQPAEAQSKPWPVPPQAASVENPVPSTPATLKDAKALYMSYCSPCHGNKGKGDGIAASGLNPKPADHTSATIQSESDGSLFYKLSEGRSPMPAYKSILKEDQRWELINYIRTLAKGGKK